MGAEDTLRSSLCPASGGSSIGEGPLCGERAETEEQSEMREGALSADM